MTYAARTTNIAGAIVNKRLILSVAQRNKLIHINDKQKKLFR